MIIIYLKFTNTMVDKLKEKIDPTKKFSRLGGELFVCLFYVSFS